MADEKLLDYDYFIMNIYDEYKRQGTSEGWLKQLIDDCSELYIDNSIKNSIIQEIHEGLAIDFEETVKYFWMVFLINPLIAIRAYQECILFGKIDLYLAFKHVQPLNECSPYLNPQKDNFYIFCIEAMMQQKMNAEELLAVSNHYLEYLYHPYNESYSTKRHKKYLTQENLEHILSNIDPSHIIVFLSFITAKYIRRLKAKKLLPPGRCYAGDMYNVIISYIRNNYISLSEFIRWDDCNINFFYNRFYTDSMEFYETYLEVDAVFSTEADIAIVSNNTGIPYSEPKRHGIIKMNV